MRTITREQLKEKLDRGENFTLLMALDHNAYERMHIPGSVQYDDLNQAIQEIAPDEEVVVYCSNPLCQASVRAYYYLREHGVRNLSRFAGGLMEWQTAGYPLEGRQAEGALAAA